MKNITAIIFLFLTTFQFVGAQNSEGHITYKIDFSTDDPETEAMLGMMNGSTLDLYFSNLNSRVEMKMGALMSTTTIMDLSTKKMLTLTSGMMGNNAIPGTIPENEEVEEDDDVKITLTSETKKILGLTAKKAIITVEDGKTFDFWYTDEISAKLLGQPMVKKNGIPGILLEMSLNESGMKMTFTAIAFENKLPKKNQLFNMDIPEGYIVRDAEEMMTPGM